MQHFRLARYCWSYLDRLASTPSSNHVVAGGYPEMAVCCSVGTSNNHQHQWNPLPQATRIYPLRGAAKAFFGRIELRCVRLAPDLKRKKGYIRCSQELEQMKEMAAAEKRWEYQIKEGKVKALTPKEAGYAIQLSKYILLDVRPSLERKKAWVKDSSWIPIFDVDKTLDPGAILKKASNFALGGWWTGVPLMRYNERFMPDVVAKIPKSANIIVTCQKGLRSLAACEQLYKAGYRNLFWLNGGLDSAEEGDLEREGSTPFKFAGLGGVSEFLGWTDIQRTMAAKEGYGYRAMLFGRLVIVVVLFDALFLGVQQMLEHMKDFN